ncbi:MAG: alkaline shock response membrane anchor protein AmaP [Bacillota bacterium]|nr:alkaline shock response membrane anchor protein AmaP [Bacillota bacterium]
MIGVGVLDRVVLALFALAVAVISFLFLVMAAAGWMEPLDYLRQILDYTNPNGRWLIGVLSGLSLATSLRFLYFGFRRDRPWQTLIHQTDMGEVRISISAVENLVTKVARGLKGVRDVRASVIQTPGGLGVRIRGVVSPEVNVPQTAREIQQAVADYTRNIVGVEVTEVKVMVQNITNEARRGRVE